MIYKFLSTLMSVIGICPVFELTPDGITDGLLKILKPKSTIAAQSAALKGGNKKYVFGSCFLLCGCGNSFFVLERNTFVL